MKMSQMRAGTNAAPGVPIHRVRSQLDDYLCARGHSLESIYQEMEMDSRYVDTHDDVSHSDAKVCLHSHTFYEMLYCCGGNLQYLLDTRRYRLQQGDIVYIPPNTSHRALFLDQLVEPYARCVLWISPAYAQLLADAFPGELLLPEQPFVLRTVSTPWQEQLGGLFRRGVQESYDQGPGWQTCVCGNTMQLLVEMMRARAGDHTLRPKAEKQELLDRLLIYIENHLHEKITLADTARRFLISESSINQLFRRRMKVSFYRFVTQRRLIAAKVLLQEGLPAEEISARVGFGDYSSFYRAFKREYGISPAEYRRSACTAGPGGRWTEP